MDEMLVIKAKKGDKDSFAEIISEVKNQAYKIAFCYLKNEDDSLDAVCDAVEKAYYNIKKLKQPKYFKTWFIRIVINECKQQLKAKQRVIYMADELYIRDSNNIIEDKIDLQSLLEQLPSLDRLIIYMKYYLGYTLNEISQIVNLPEGTVKSKLYKNLKIMRSKLEVREG